MPTIPKLSNPGKPKAPAQTPTDPMQTLPLGGDPMEEIINNIPSLDNTSAYRPSGPSGFFTRDGKVIPIG